MLWLWRYIYKYDTILTNYYDSDYTKVLQVKVNFYTENWLTFPLVIKLLPVWAGRLFEAPVNLSCIDRANPDSSTKYKSKVCEVFCYYDKVLSDQSTV